MTKHEKNPVTESFSFVRNTQSDFDKSQGVSNSIDILLSLIKCVIIHLYFDEKIFTVNYSKETTNIIL